MTLRSDRARQDGAEARLRGTIDAFMPTVSLLGSTPLTSKLSYHPDIPFSTYGPDTTRRRDPRQYGVTANLPLFDGFQRWNNLLSARTSSDAGRFLTVDARQQVLLDTASAYIAVMRDRRILAQRHRQLASVQAIRSGVVAQLEVNNATRTDAALAASRVADAQAGIDQAAADLRASELEFARLTGRPPDRLARPALPSLPKGEAEFADLVRNRNPRLAAARLDARAAGYLAESAKGSLLPQVSFQFTHGRQDDITGTLNSVIETTAKLQAVIPLYQPGAIPKVYEAEALARQKTFDTEEAVRQLVTAARAAFARREAFKGQLSSLSARVSALRAAARGYEIERSAGFRTVIDELNSRSELAQAEILLATGEAEWERLAFLLAALTGSLTNEPGAGSPRARLAAVAYVEPPVTGSMQRVERAPPLRAGLTDPEPRVPARAEPASFPRMGLRLGSSPGTNPPELRGSEASRQPAPRVEPVSAPALGLRLGSVEADAMPAAGGSAARRSTPRIEAGPFGGMGLRLGSRQVGRAPDA